MSMVSLPPKVSVIIPAYNGDRFLVDAIESVFNQTYKNYEIIIIDDGSTDNTRTILEPYFNKISYIYQTNQGVAAARNRGIKEAKGEYIAFLDQDDYFLPEKLEKQVEILDKKPHIGMVHSGWYRVNEVGAKIGEVKPWKKSPKLTLKEWVEKKQILLSAMLFRRDWLNKIDGLDTQFHQACDIDLILRLSLTGCEATWLKEMSFCYREHDRNDSLNTRLQVQESHAVNEKFFNLPGIPQSIIQIKNICFYFNYVWSAWRLYLTDHLDLMSEYLEKSIKYSPFSPEETVINWLQEFSLNYREHTQSELDIYTLTHHPIWQNLIKKNFPNFHLTLVSVIIPVYNGETYIKDAIQSVLNQTYPSYEIIVIDDGSTDQTRQILQPYWDKIKYIYQKNQGVAITRNRGIEEAQGELIAFLDQDDYFLPNKLSLQVEAFTKNTHLGIVNSGWRNVNEKGELLADTTLWKDLPILNLVGWILWKPIFPGAMMFRRHWLEKAGGFNPNYQQSPDVDLVLRLVGMGCEGDWVREVTVCYRQHDKNTSRNTPQQVTELEQVLEDFFTHYNLPEIGKKLERQCRYNSLVWAAGRFYYHGYPDLMVEYLQKSLNYTPFSSKLETWADWGEQLLNNLRDFGKKFNPLDWVNSAEWRAITQQVLPENCPLVSVIIPTYNNEIYLAEAINSVLNQTYPFYEIIVIDDGSTDQTQEILKTYGNRINTIYQENQGVSVARNRGIKVSQGELIAFLDGDDYFLPDKLAHQVACFAENPTLGIVNSGWYVVNEEGEILAHQMPWAQLLELDLKAWILWRAVLPSAMMFRRHWLEKIGGFKPGLAYAEDVELVLRLAQAGCQAIWLEKITVNYRLHRSNATTAHKTPRQAECFDQLLDQFFSQANLSKELRDIEGEARYNYLVWMAWRFYETSNYDQMAEYLQKSLKYTPYTIQGTIFNWIGFLAGYSEGKGDEVEGDLLINLPQWRQLITPLLSQKKPRVSVIMPVYNGDRDIRQAIESVGYQSYQDWELIVIDDGSTDKTRQILAPYGDVIRDIYQENQGVSTARNRGIQEAKGELIAFLDSDDYFLPDKLAEQVACFDAQPQLAIVNSGWQLVNPIGTKIADATMWELCPKLDLETWIVWKPVLPSAMIVSRKWLILAGGFDPKLSTVEDIDLVLRIARLGGESVWLEKITVCYRQHQNSATSKTLENVENLAQSFDFIYDRFFSQELPEHIRELEGEARYKYLVWLAWQFYQAQFPLKTIEYLEKSLFYSPFPPVETVYNWICHFDGYSISYGYPLDTYSLSNMPEWKELIEQVISDRAYLQAAEKNPIYSTKHRISSKEKTPQVSVIIPTYNSEHYIKDAIESVLNQTYQDYEIIVIDDGSTDNTRQILEPYQGKINYIYQKNQGVSHARNRGLLEAKGELIAFLDADDFFLPEKLTEQVACFATQPDLGIVTSGWRLVNETGENLSDVEPWKYCPKLDLENWIIWKPVLPSAMMFSRKWLQLGGGFNPDLKAAEDTDLVLRLIRMGCQSTFVKQVTTCYRQHHSSVLAKSIGKLAKSVDTVIDNFFADPDLPEGVLKVEKQARYNSDVWLAWRCFQTGNTTLMAEYLQKSLQYSPYLPTETVIYWLEFFKAHALELGAEMDISSLLNLPEWKQLMEQIISYT
jgi:glycosyltransferase involved in cell wall biosynthesis